jgi:hypothetical protein
MEHTSSVDGCGRGAIWSGTTGLLQWRCGSSDTRESKLKTITAFLNFVFDIESKIHHQLAIAHATARPRTRVCICGHGGFDSNLEISVADNRI